MFDIILVDDGSGADFAPLFAIAQSNYAENKSQKGERRCCFKMLLLSFLPMNLMTVCWNF